MNVIGLGPRIMLDHAFDTLRCIAVEFRTHFFNYQSCRGIERLGAKLDGVLRNHQIADNGTLRDTCVYIIIASEWPTVKAHLTWQMESREGRPLIDLTKLTHSRQRLLRNPAVQ